MREVLDGKSLFPAEQAPQQLCKREREERRGESGHASAEHTKGERAKRKDKKSLHSKAKLKFP